MSILILNDLHFGGGLALYPEDQRLSIQVKMLQRSLTVHKRYKAIIFAGDTFDVPVVKGHVVKAFVSCISNVKVPMHFIAGNHDMESSSYDANEAQNHACSLHYLEAINNPLIHIHKGPSLVTIAGIPVELLPWPHTKPNYPDARLVVMHKEFAGTIFDSGRIVKDDWAEKFPLEYAVNNNQIWISGHLHIYQYHYDGRLVYPGAQYSVKTIPLAANGKPLIHRVALVSMESDMLMISYAKLPTDYAQCSASLEKLTVKQVTKLMETHPHIRLSLDLVDNRALPPELSKYHERIVTNSKTALKAMDKTPITNVPEVSVGETFDDMTVRSMVFKRIRKSLGLRGRNSLRLWSLISRGRYG